MAQELVVSTSFAPLIQVPSSAHFMITLPGQLGHDWSDKQPPLLHVAEKKPPQHCFYCSGRAEGIAALHNTSLEA